MARKRHQRDSLQRKLDRLFAISTERMHVFWNQHGLILRSWLVFGLTIGSLVIVQLLMNLWTNYECDRGLNVMTAQMLATPLWLLGYGGQTAGTVVTSRIFSAEIITECTAIFPMMIFVAAVIAYPSGLRKKLWGIALGLPAISLIIFFVVLLWLLWAELFVHHHEAQHA